MESEVGAWWRSTPGFFPPKILSRMPSSIGAIFHTFYATYAWLLETYGATVESRYARYNRSKKGRERYARYRASTKGIVNEVRWQLARLQKGTCEGEE